MSRPIRLWHQSMTELDGLDAYRRRLVAHASGMFGAAVAVDVHGLTPGSYGGAAPTDVLRLPDLRRRVSEQSLAAARTAEAEGYDAFVIGSFSEPMLQETRDAVSIAVVSVTESAALAGCSYGRRTAFLANAPSIARLVAASIERHGLGGRAVGGYAIEPALTEPELVDQDPSRVIDMFTAFGRALIAAGADVLVPAEAVMSEVLWDAGLRDVDGVLVLDSVGVAWRYALMLVGLKQDRTPAPAR